MHGFLPVIDTLKVSLRGNQAQYLSCFRFALFSNLSIVLLWCLLNGHPRPIAQGLDAQQQQHELVPIDQSSIFQEAI